MLDTTREEAMKHYSILAALLLAACGQGGSQAQKNLPAPAFGNSTAPQASGAAMVNADFEQTGADDDVPGWNKTQHAGPPSYLMRIDPVDAYAGHGSFRMTRTSPQVFGSLTQTLDARTYAGKTVEFSAMLKSKGVGPGGWKLFVDADLPGTLVYSQGLTGDTAWKSESVRLKVPAVAHQLTVGVTLLDAGDGWMDDVALRVVN
ncbi:MAG TPA: hypothetical protein VLK26_02295 [Rudaea sp.]|nr:hypothetical protein [Rudaea sp.]